MRPAIEAGLMLFVEAATLFMRPVLKPRFTHDFRHEKSTVVDTRIHQRESWS